MQIYIGTYHTIAGVNFETKINTKTTSVFSVQDEEVVAQIDRIIVGVVGNSLEDLQKRSG